MNVCACENRCTRTSCIRVYVSTCLCTLCTRKYIYEMLDHNARGFDGGGVFYFRRKRKSKSRDASARRAQGQREVVEKSRTLHLSSPHPLPPSPERLPPPSLRLSSRPKRATRQKTLSSLPPLIPPKRATRQKRRTGMKPSQHAAAEAPSGHPTPLPWSPPPPCSGRRCGCRYGFNASTAAASAFTCSSKAASFSAWAAIFSS